MGGIDLAEANRTVVEGLYNRLAIARNACGDLILYNWKFAEIEIAPGICNTLDEGTSIVINGLIQVTEQDEVTVLGIAPPPEPVEPLDVVSNGVYVATPPTSGFNPVSVNVPIPRPRLIPITIRENGEYTPPAGVDGFNRVIVSTQGADFPELAQVEHIGNIANYEIANTGIYAILIAADGTNAVDITASLSSENILYTDKQNVPKGPYGSCGIVIIAECSEGDILTASVSNVNRQCLYVVHFADSISIEEPTMMVAKDTPATVSFSTDDFFFCMAVSTADRSRLCEISGGWKNGPEKNTSQYLFLQGWIHGQGSVTASGTSYATNVSFAMKLVE